MPSGCAWDLLIFGISVDASGGNVALALCAGDEHFTADGAAGVGTKVQPKSPGFITGISGQSEDGGLTNMRVGLLGSLNKIGGSLFHASQTEDLTLDELLARCMMPVTLDDRIVCDITNGAAKMDAVGVLLGKGTKPKLSSEPFGEIPEGAAWREFTTAHTSIADTLVKGDMTFPDFTLKQNVNYKILAIAFEGATAMMFRIRAKSGPDAVNAPGVPCAGDTDIISHPCYFSHPPQFVGKDGCQLETLCSAGDTAGVGMVLLVESALNIG